MDEQRYYDQVALELQDGKLRAGLWTRAVAETNSEGAPARALYIRLRVQELIANERVAATQAEVAEEIRRKEREDQENAERKKTYEARATEWYYGPIMVVFALVGIILVIAIIAGVSSWFE
jgi:hypothetical protein